MAFTRLRPLQTALTALCLCGSALASPPIEYTNSGAGYQVAFLRPGGDRPCMLFQLVGVAVSDGSLTPASPWFSIPETAPEFKSMVALLFTSKTTGKPVLVTTSGDVPASCGHPGVAVVQMP